MLFIDVYNSDTGETIRIGTFSDFVGLLTAQIGSVATVMLKSGFSKKAMAALDRVVQKARDEKSTQ